MRKTRQAFAFYFLVAEREMFQFCGENWRRRIAVTTAHTQFHYHILLACDNTEESALFNPTTAPSGGSALAVWQRTGQK